MRLELNRVKSLRLRTNSLFEKGKNSPFIKALGIYTFLNFFLRGISFIITPLFTNYISPEQYGNLNLYLNSINIIAPLIILCTNTISVDYFKYEKNELSAHLSSYFIFSLAVTASISTLSVLFQNPLTAYFQLSFGYILLIPLLCFFNLIIDTTFVILRNETMLKKISWMTILRSGVEIILSIIFIIYLAQGAEGRIDSLIISTLSISIICAYFLHQRIGFQSRFQFQFIKKEARFWTSTIVGFLFVISFTVIDKYIIKYFCTPFELGNYSLASQFGFIILTLSTAISSAYFPQLYRDLSQNVSYHLVKRKLIFILTAVIVLSFASNIIVYLAYKYLINSQYADSWEYYFLVSISYGLWAMISVLYGFLYYYKMDKLIFNLGILSMIIFVPFEFFMTRYYSISGMLIAQIVYFCISFMIILNLAFKRIRVETNNS